MKYTTEFNGKTLEYSIGDTTSFSAEENRAIFKEMVRVEEPEQYELRKNDEEFLVNLGALIDLEGRYKLFLDLLPQYTFSKAGTHPSWVAEEVEENTYVKEDVKDDIESMLDNINNIDDLKEELKDYFGIGDEHD